MKTSGKIIAALALATMITACDKKNDPALVAPAAPADATRAVYYSEADTVKMAEAVGAKLGVQVVLKNAKDYANEYNTKRLLGLLDKDQDAIRPQLAMVEKIVIDGALNIEESLGHYIIHLSFDISESDLIRLFSNDFTTFRAHHEASREFQVSSGLNVVDSMGFTSVDIPNVGKKLKIVSSAVAFSQDPTFTTLTLSNFFGITGNGMVINIFASEETIISELKDGIAARIRWGVEVSPIITRLGLNVSFQPGIFSGSEMNDVIVFVKKNAVLLKSLSTKFSTFIVGKRFDDDFSTATMLVDYKASDDALKSQILTVEPKSTDVDFDSASANLVTTLAARSFTLSKVIVDLPRTINSLSLLKDFTANVAPNLDINVLKQLDVKVLHLTDSDQTLFVPGSKILFVHLPASAADVNATLASGIVRTAFEDLERVITSYAAIQNLPLNMSGLIAAPSTNDRLSVFADWLTSALTSDVIVKNKIMSVTVTVDSTSITSFSAGALKINLADFDPSRMPSILLHPTPAPRF